MSGKTKQPKHKMSAMAKKEERTAWLFIALPFLGFLLFMAYPICFAVFASMSKWTGMNSLVDNFCGLQNYINIFHDEKFWKSLLTTIIYLIGIPIGMILGLLLAMGMNRKIPGIRLGYLLAQKEICEKIAYQLPEWNVSVIAQRIGMDILDDSIPGWNRRKYLMDTIELIQKEKEFLKHELTKIFGNQMTIFPSEADFLLLKTQIPLYRLLLERGILIRNCANYTGLGQDFYRIAVKGHPENVQLIEALLDIKKKGEEKRYGKH